MTSYCNSNQPIVKTKIRTKYLYVIKDFHQLGRVGLVVAMSMCCCLSPSHAIFLRGRTGADRALSVDWYDLDLDIE